MKLATSLLFLAVLASPLHAAVVHNEAVNGDLSSNAAAPTPLAFAVGGNTVIGTVRSSTLVTGDRDFWTFTIGATQRLTALNLLAYSPAFISFCAFNSGPTSYVPSLATDPLFLAGIHIDGTLLGLNLMPFFVGAAVTTNALPAPELPPGTYSFVIQQTSSTTTSYSLEFVVDQPVPADSPSWGAIKALYQ